MQSSRESSLFQPHKRQRIARTASPLEHRPSSRAHNNQPKSLRLHPSSNSPPSRPPSTYSPPNRRQESSSRLNTILHRKRYYKRLLSCDAGEAQRLLDAFQVLLDTDRFEDRQGLIAVMQKISIQTGTYPQSLLLHGPVPLLEDDPVASGSYADIYKMNFGSQSICVKVLRSYQQPLVEHMVKVYGKETIVWGQLSHPNILPFYGIFKYRTRLSFISPWAENGDITQYLARHPGANRTLLCLDVATGLQYLHSYNILHGDLKGVNVLVDKAGRAVLGDFGLSAVNDPDILSWTAETFVTTKGGTARWQAPELHEPEENFNKISNSKESDVFAWANVCYQIFTGRLPYFESSRECSVILKIVGGKTPTRPGENDPAWFQHGLTDRIWSLLQECWKFEPLERPDIKTVLKRLSLEKPTDSRPPGEWGQKGSAWFRNAQGITFHEPLLNDLDRILSRVLQDV